MRLFFAAWVVGGLVASLVAIVFGRTERLRIARFQNRVMLGHLALTVAVVLATWSYVLHPGPRAIRLVTRAQGSPDGAFAYVQTQVDRGDPSTFKPTFLLDLAAGRSLLLNADPFQGPWPSADGRLMVWSEATPFFFRPIWRLVGGTTSLRVQKEGVDVQPLPLPRRMTERFAPGTEYFINSVESVLPSPDGSVFAIVGNRRLTFVSRTTGERPDVDFGSGAPSLRAMAFVPSGALRTLLVRNGSAGPLLEWADIDPASNRVTKIASTEAGGQVRVQFNRKATSALLTVTGGNAARSSLSLMRVDDADPAAARPTVLLPETPVPRAIFLADGRIATTSGGMHQTVLKVFSATGAPLLSTALSDGVATIEAEMFPGLVAIGMGLTREIAIVDCSNGNIVRRIPGMTSPISYAFASPNVPAPPPGTPGARLLLSQGKLFDLATPSAEPRLLLPVAR